MSFLADAVEDIPDGAGSDHDQSESEDYNVPENACLACEQEFGSQDKVGRIQSRANPGLSAFWFYTFLMSNVTMFIWKFNWFIWDLDLDHGQLVSTWWQQ